jgi:hypothetical protein
MYGKLNIITASIKTQNDNYSELSGVQRDEMLWPISVSYTSIELVLLQESDRLPLEPRLSTVKHST